MSNEEKGELDFGSVDEQNIDTKLLGVVEQKKARSVRKQWGYTRSNGDRVMLPEIFERINQWPTLFKDVGDTVVTYDPAHTALPWAGVQFSLQVIQELHFDLATAHGCKYGRIVEQLSAPGWQSRTMVSAI
jgi:hypothetical protein